MILGNGHGRESVSADGLHTAAGELPLKEPQNVAEHESSPPFAEVLLARRRGEESLVLTYSLPFPTPAEGWLGAYVLVPLSSGSATGYVVGVADREPEGEFQVRPILEVLDDSARLSPELVELGRWIASEYCADLAACLQAMVPAGAQEEVVTAYQAVSSADEPAPAQASLFGAEELEPEPSPLLVLLRASDGPLTTAEMESILGQKPSDSELAALIKEGLVRARHVLAPARSSRKTLLALQPVPGADVESLPKRASAQREILREILRRQEPLPLVDLEKRRAAARQLVEKGLARVTSIPVLRRPASHGVGASAATVRQTRHQCAAVAAINQAIDRRQGESALLHGITGSGKTEVYLSAISHALEVGGRAIVLVPEISLTPQTVGRFQARFGDRVAVLHSALGRGERLDEWTRARDGDASIVIGARSAVFAPVEDLRLIVIDEEHEASYKQNSTPRYNAREAALARGRQTGAAVVLGSATPSLESYLAAREGDHRLLVLPERVAGGGLPPVEIIDMRTQPYVRRQALVSEPLEAALRDTLDRGEQAILLLNRRGWAPFVLCRECGEAIRCADCDVSLTYHQRENLLRCHHCGHERPTPLVCSVCHSEHLHPMGTGAERAEQEVREFFPDARLQRMDRDTTREKGAHGRILSRFERGELDILIGTQMIAKGLDFPRVTLVGVLMADTGLHFPDFRAAEQTFCLLTQVSGRAGRGGLGGRVVVQTFSADHYAIEHAARHDYMGFYESEIELRRRHQYPPFSRLANVLSTDEDPFLAQRAAEAFATAAEATRPEEGRVSDANPAALSRLRGTYRFHVEMFAPAASLVAWCRNAWASTPEEFRKGLTIDVDPLSLL
jgi:primosomal protein N' (replication factor Y)